MNSPALVLTLRNENAEIVETRVVEGEVLSIGRSPAVNLPRALRVRSVDDVASRFVALAPAHVDDARLAIEMQR
jgi:hypothetical protein